jgi:hypothetical protein
MESCAITYGTGIHTAIAIKFEVALHRDNNRDVKRA